MGGGGGLLVDTPHLFKCFLIKGEKERILSVIHVTSNVDVSIEKNTNLNFNVTNHKTSQKKCLHLEES